MLGGSKRVISDAHGQPQGGHRVRIRGYIAALPSSLGVQRPGAGFTWVSPRSHPGQHSVVAAAIRQAFDQSDRASAGETWHRMADQLRYGWPKLAELIDKSE